MLAGLKIRAKMWVTATGLAVLALSGCSLHHKTRALVLPPFTPVELTQIPEPADPIIVDAGEDEDLPPVPVAEGATVPKRQRKRVVKAAVAPAPTEPSPPVQVAAATAPPPEAGTPPPPTEAGTPPEEAASVIGDLTPGGDQDPNAQQEAAELIKANEKRLKALPAETRRAQAPLVSNVRNFQKQAQQALSGGDAGGAKTLATKAKLLLDDLEKAAGL